MQASSKAKGREPNTDEVAGNSQNGVDLLCGNLLQESKSKKRHLVCVVSLFALFCGRTRLWQGSGNAYLSSVEGFLRGRPFFFGGAGMAAAGRAFLRGRPRLGLAGAGVSSIRIFSSGGTSELVI